MSAYNELYLSDAKTNLAICFDYAINDCKLNPDTFVFMFINSRYSKLFETGDPGIIGGTSGIELARLIISEHIPDFAFFDARSHFNKSKEFWALYYLAEFQWKTGRRFKDIFNRISLTEIINMYNPYHEADVSKFIKDLDRKIANKNIDSKLKTIRLSQGLSQSQLAKLANVKLRSIQMYEQKQNDIDKAQANTLFSLAKVLRCNIEDLLEDVRY